MKRSLRLAPVLILLTGLGCASLPPSPNPEGPEISHLNIQARAGAVVEIVHGTPVSDPFRSLEEDSPLTRRWIAAQNAHTARQLAPSMRPEREARLRSLFEIASVGDAQFEGETMVFYRREGAEEQGAYYSALAPAFTPSQEPILSPATFGERASIDYIRLSPAGHFLAFGVAQNGDERATLRVIDLRTGELLADRLPHAKWSHVSWLNDESGFYYTRYPAEHEIEFDAEHPETQDTYLSRAYFHSLGFPFVQDPMVFAAGDATDFPSVSVAADGEHLFLQLSRGWSANDIWIARRDEHQRPTEITPLIVGVEARTSVALKGNELLMLTNIDAPHYRVMGTDLTLGSDALSDRTGWRELVPESSDVIDEWELLGDELLLVYTHQLSSSLKSFQLLSTPIFPLVRRDIGLPPASQLSSLIVDRAGTRALFSLSGFQAPPSILTLTATSNASTLVEVQTDVDFSEMEYRIVHIRSADGTEFPLQLLHRRGLQMNADNPVLLYGYGGFNVSLLPGFQRNLIYWLERGGVYAVANIRGGGEFGEAWHRAGAREHKERVFEDFEAAIHWLSESQLSRPARIAINGGSNGGLLMGAMLTRVPERVGAVAAYVGLYDMVRYHHFPPAEIWEPEYMTSESAVGFQVLHAYSPYHRVPERVALPATLIETADHDSRVYWGHSTKFAARLQTSNTSDKPVLFHMERAQGHGGGARLSDTVARYVRMYTFIEHALGML